LQQAALEGVEFAEVAARIVESASRKTAGKMDQSIANGGTGVDVLRRCTSVAPQHYTKYRDFDTDSAPIVTDAL
jgi:hypothetical protein